MSLEHLNIDIDRLESISSEMAHHYQIVPKKDNIDTIFYISKLKNNNVNIEELELFLGKHIVFDPIESTTLQKLLDHFYKKTLKSSIQQASVNVNDEHFLERLINEAKQIDSSDIHFEVYENNARVRLRIDGVLIEKHTIPLENYLELVNKIKIKSNLDITEKRLPQDGRINFDDFDIRVSILPTLYGEKIVMRILGKDATAIQIDKLGFDDVEKKKYLESVKKSNGIVLISGPTGSGKTTTLYATLKELNNEKRNIVTVEDPIEYTLDGISQVQLRENIGLNFASTLRTFLRQDPDIIMIGEIRDPETANMTIRASLTGHLVLSTIHTNSAWGTISRLIDMEIPPFLIASTLNVSVAQRLVRKLCNDCKKEAQNITEEFSLLKDQFNGQKIYEAKGCPSCYQTGYKGRKAIYEIIPIHQELVNAIVEKKQNIYTYLKENNIATLQDNVIHLVKEGVTSIEEIYPLLI